ncbi:hypothetical protein QE152_g15493 [Popillia japonica]|uniref:Uncharacterized protein n=1 Tax=Popillia japonica TaxID=7064 RepID=A0AAW1L5L0_POPJA
MQNRLYMTTDLRDTSKEYQKRPKSKIRAKIQNQLEKIYLKSLDMSTKDAESPLYDDRSQRYFEGISEASQEQNLRKDSESTGEDLPEKLEDLNSPPTHVAADLGQQKEQLLNSPPTDHVAADLGQQKVAVVDVLEQTESVEDAQSSDETYTKTNKRYTSKSEASLDRSFAKFLSDTIPRRRPADKDSTTKVLDKRSKYTEPPSFEEERQKYFEGMLNKPQEQSSGKDSERTTVIAKVNLKQTDHIEESDIKASPGRQPSRPLAKLDRSFSKYCINTSPSTTGALDMSTKKYVEPPSFEEQRQKYFETISEKDVSTEAILTESSTELFTEVADVEALNEDLEANLEQSQNNLVGHESKSDNEEELMMMQAPNQQESIDSAATELEELLALSTADVKHEVSAENQVKIGKAQCVQTLSSELEQALELSQTDCCGSSTTTAAEPGLLEVHPCDNSDEAKPILEGASPTPSGDKTETIIQNENPIPNEEICNENYINSLAGDDIEEIYLVVPGEAVSGDKTEDDDVVFVLDSSMCDSGEFAGVEDDLIRINFLIEEDEVPESPPEVEQPPNTTDVEYRYNGSDIPTADEEVCVEHGETTTDVEYRYNGSDIPTADEEVCVEHGETQLEYNDDVAYHEVIPKNLYKDDENGDVVFLSNQDYISEAVHEVQTTQSSNDSASLQDTRNEAQPVIEDSEVVIEASELSIGEGDQIQAEAEITKGSCLEGGGEVLVEVQTQVDDAVSQKDAEVITGEATQIDDEALRKDTEVITSEATQADDEVASKEFAQPILPQSEPDIPEKGANYEDVAQVTTEVPTEHIEGIKNDTAEGVSEVTDDVDLVKQPESCQNREVRDDEVPIDLSKQNGEVGSENEVVPEDDHLISNAARIDRVENHNEVNSSKVETRDDLECIKLEEAAQIGSNIDLKNETLHTDTNTVMNVHEVNTVPHYVNANYVDVQMKYVKDEVTVTSHCEDLQNLVKAQITDFSDKCQILYPSVAIQHHTTPRPMSLSTLTSKDKCQILYPSVAIQHHTTPRPMSLSTLTSKFAESLAEKAEDIYYENLDILATAAAAQKSLENLDILATAAAAQKSLKVEGSSKPKRSRLKMAAFNKSRAAKFKPNEVRETLRQQPANTIDATILAESDFNPASEDSCDSYGGKLIIAEEEHISNIDEAVFDEDTVDEKIAFVSTKLEDVEDTEIRICITDSEKYERAFNELELLEMDDVVEDDGSKRGKLRNFGSKSKIKDKKRKPRQNKNNLDLEVKPLSGGKSASVKVEGKKPRRKSPKKNAVGVKNEIQTGAVKKEEKIKGDLGLGFDRFLMGESLMLTHDGEFVSSPGNKSKLISPDKVKVADEIKTSNDASTIKQPIRTKAALKSYDKKNLGQQIGEDKFKLRPYVKLVTDPTIQKMIDNLPEKMPKITLARKNYRSLLDARKLLHRTSLIQNQKLKPAPPKIESPTKKDQNFQKTPQQTQIEEARKSPPIPEGRRLSLIFKKLHNKHKLRKRENLLQYLKVNGYPSTRR